MSRLPNHLGGHMNKVHTDRATLDYLIKEFGVKSFLDIGCGPGDMVQIAQDRGLYSIGIDGDHTLIPEWHGKGITVFEHDFTRGRFGLDHSFDLGWSVEFLEHIDKQYQNNYMEVFQKCKYVVCTAAPPGYPGHHHVNCRDTNYWISVFDNYGFNFCLETTRDIRAGSVMKKPFMQTTGMFFYRR